MIRESVEMRISVAEQFSKVPAGRFITDGPYSGERFRNELLLPALKANQSVTINLDGVEGYGSSFLEEAFGGLVRQCGYTAAELRGKLKIESSDAGWEEEVWSYIENPPEGRAAN